MMAEPMDIKTALKHGEALSSLEMNTHNLAYVDENEVHVIAKTALVVAALVKEITELHALLLELKPITDEYYLKCGLTAHEEVQPTYDKLAKFYLRMGG